jgi:hypothetical protein
MFCLRGFVTVLLCHIFGRGRRMLGRVSILLEAFLAREYTQIHTGRRSYVSAKTTSMLDIISIGELLIYLISTEYAFWSGFFAAWLANMDSHACALAGRSLAELKLVRVGLVLNPLIIYTLI